MREERRISGPRNRQTFVPDVPTPAGHQLCTDSQIECFAISDFYPKPGESSFKELFCYSASK